MQIRILGCYGGEMPGRRTTCLLIDDNVMIDAGAATSALPLKDQAKIDAILLSHSHLDHVRDLGFLADNIFGKREKPVRIFGLPETIETVKKHVLNDSVWPDFSKLPTPENPIITFQEIREGMNMQVEGLTVTAVKVNHTVPTAGFIIRAKNSGFVFSGDTGPTEELWKVCAKQDSIKAVFLETSFPNRLGELAKSSGHLTPEMAVKEIEKLGRPEIPVYLYHMKPPSLKEIIKEVEASNHGLHVIEQGDLIEI